MSRETWSPINPEGSGHIIATLVDRKGNVVEKDVVLLSGAQTIEVDGLVYKRKTDGCESVKVDIHRVGGPFMYSKYIPRPVDVKLDGQVVFERLPARAAESYLAAYSIYQ